LGTLRAVGIFFKIVYWRRCFDIILFIIDDPL